MKNETALQQSHALGTVEIRKNVELLVGLLGDPVAHTLSPAMQNAAFQALGARYRYLAFRVRAEDFEHAMEGLAALGAVGTNITVPHKERAFRWARRLDPSASRTGAVNTVLFSEEGGKATTQTSRASVRRLPHSLPEETALSSSAPGARRARPSARCKTKDSHISRL